MPLVNTGELRAALDALDAMGLAESVRPHLASLYRLAAPADATLDALTRREREVLEWVAAGKTNRDIAQIIGARPRTIEKHLERVYEKLGVEGRTAAAMRLVKL